jgi:cell division protein FtsL
MSDATLVTAVNVVATTLLARLPAERDAALARAMVTYRELWARQHRHANGEQADLAAAEFARLVIERIEVGEHSKVPTEARDPRRRLRVKGPR